MRLSTWCSIIQHSTFRPSKQSAEADATVEPSGPCKQGRIFSGEASIISSQVKVCFCSTYYMSEFKNSLSVPVHICNFLHGRIGSHA